MEFETKAFNDDDGDDDDDDDYAALTKKFKYGRMSLNSMGINY